MEKNRDYLAKILTLGALLSFTALILVVTLQVVARFMLPKAPSWTEEASRFLFIYAVAFSAPLALKRGEYVRVELIIQKLPKKFIHIFEALIDLILAAFFGIIFYYGLTFAELGTIQTSPAMGLLMVIPYSSISFMTLCIMWYSLRNMYINLRHFHKDIKGSV